MSERSKVEQLKHESGGLRGSIATELFTDDTGFSKESVNLLKFHGMYQQDDRDSRKGSKEKSYALMLRGRIPGGRLSAEQYLVWDRLADNYSNNGSLRLTTRQSVQLHGVLKSNIKATIQEINHALLSTEGACGDVVRNITQVENPWGDPKLAQLDAIAEELSTHFLAKTRAYSEIWLDGEQLPVPETETLYGTTYLPRKFKIAVTATGNNSVDIYTNDLAFAATYKEDILDGFFVFAGGGMGMTHKKEQTFARVADTLGWVPKDAYIAVAEAIVKIHRDFGNRDDRKNARLKYVIAERGVEWIRLETERRSGIKLIQKTLPEWNTPNLLGWHYSSENTYTFGLHLLAGRIQDTHGKLLKSALKEVIKTYGLAVQITADQDILLLNINKKDKLKIEHTFQKFGLLFNELSKLETRALACVALPTCGLAITEAERYIREAMDKINALLDKYELQKRAPVFRMTGCPNGCARPYSAELAFVGRSKNAYSIFIGGSAEGHRIAELFEDNVKVEDLYPIIEQLFALWKSESDPSERFGDFVTRRGLETIRETIDCKDVS